MNGHMPALLLAWYLACGLVVAFFVGRGVYRLANRTEELQLIGGLDRDAALFITIGVFALWPLYIGIGLWRYAAAVMRGDAR